MVDSLAQTFVLLPRLKGKLSATVVTTNNMQETVTRLSKNGLLENGIAPDFRVIVLVNDTHTLPTSSRGDLWTSLAELQIMLLNVSDPAPVILAASSASIVPTLKAYAADLEHPHKLGVQPAIDIAGVVATATTIAPARHLKTWESARILDICGSIKGLERITRDESLQRLLCDNLGAATVQNLIEFWQDEWIA